MIFVSYIEKIIFVAPRCMKTWTYESHSSIYARSFLPRGPKFVCSNSMIPYYPWQPSKSHPELSRTWHSYPDLLSSTCFISRGLWCLDAYTIAFLRCESRHLNSGGKHDDKTRYRSSFPDNASTKNLYKRRNNSSKVVCYSPFQLKATNFFVSQVNNKAFMEKLWLNLQS